jgi:RNA-directed DNA polymerase
MSIFTYNNLYRAYLDCRKNKRSTASALEFEIDLEKNLSLLLEELATGTYHPGTSICFIVEHPHPREIFAAKFRDRVVHHLLVGQILEDSEKSFFYNSFACREGKGTHRAVRLLRRYMKSASRNGKEKIFYLQLDIKSFFVSIRHRALFSIFGDFIGKLERSEAWKQEMLWLAKTIIFYEPAKHCEIRGDQRLLALIPPHKSLFGAPPMTGLPIGNHTSQFFANLYLNRLDYFIKQTLKEKFYVRYVDDFIILGKSANALKGRIPEINGFLKEALGVELNANKTKLKNVSAGIDFLGYFIKSDHMLVRRRVVARCKGKIHDFEKVSGKLISQTNSYLGHFIHADSYGLRKKTVSDILARGGGLLLSDGDYTSIARTKDNRRQISPLAVGGGEEKAA